jgi:hypothetical protein
VHARPLRLHHGVEQRRRRDRLRQEDVDAEGGAAGLLLLAGIRADQDDRERPRLLAGADESGGIEPVHAGQHPVEDDEAEWIGRARPVAALEQRQPSSAVATDTGGIDQPAQQRLQQLAAARRCLRR